MFVGTQHLSSRTSNNEIPWKVLYLKDVNHEGSNLTSRVENSGIPTPKNPGIDISKPHITGVLGSMAHLWLSLL